ncbi:hypothetical protein RFI_32232, partial [Reticulomyxa filosa]
QKKNPDAQKEEESKDDPKEEDKFVPVMQEFYKKAEKDVKQLRKSYEDLSNNVKHLATFYGEEVKKDIKFEEFFGIFSKFRDAFVENINKIKEMEAKVEKEEKKRKAEDDKKKRKEEMKKKKQDEKERKRQMRDRKKKKSRRNLETPDAAGNENDEPKEKAADQKKTDKIIDEFSDTSKYLAKLRKNHRKGGKAKSGNNRKSMYFKAKRTLLESDAPAEGNEEEENADELDEEDGDDAPERGESINLDAK